MLFTIGEMDLVFVNESTFILTPATPVSPIPKLCVTILATDDQIIEGTESFYFVMRAENPLDRINRNVTIAITDNDGK